MSYRERIEAIKEWGKDADDILQEIGGGYGMAILCGDYNFESSFNSLLITVAKKHLGGLDTPLKIEATILKSFDYHSQYQKLRAFKDALLWLLEKSGKEKPKEGDEIKIDHEGQVWKVKIIEKL